MTSNRYALAEVRLIGAAALLALALLPALAGAEPLRRVRTFEAFQRMSPCPATGSTIGPCPGYVIDYLKPLCAGGADQPANMAWRTVAEAKIRDRVVRAKCRRR